MYVGFVSDQFPIHDTCDKKRRKRITHLKLALVIAISIVESDFFFLLEQLTSQRMVLAYLQ